jgi:hypothetical protein
LCISRKRECKNKKDFVGQTKSLREEELRNMETQNKKQNHDLCVVFFFTKICILLEQFPKNNNNNKRLKWGKNIKKSLLWIDETSLCPCSNHREKKPRHTTC